MSAARNEVERRKHIRFPLGLPVRIHLAGHGAPITAEALDLSASGGRFRSLGHLARVDQLASVAFVLPGQRRCTAWGQVIRADPSGEFAVKLGRANLAYLGFVAELAGS